MTDWIEWKGGKKPRFPRGTLVDITFRTGAKAHAEDPKEYEWDWYNSPTFPNGDAPGHIVAYRIARTVQ